jgi:endonuclease G, mitochondrial
MTRRRSKGSGRSSSRVARWVFGLNVAVALVLGGWFLFQPQERRHEVSRLVGNALKGDKRVSAIDVAWDVWQLYYSKNATATVALGDKTFVYGGVPRLSGLATGTPLRVLPNSGYVVGYYEAKRNPAWAAYRVRDIGTLPKTAERPDQFEIDWRTAARISPDDYSGSGYDRGHLAPNYAIATRFGEAAQKETFLMSNITPQRHALNAGLWKELEMKIATNYPARYGEVWVFAGPVFGDQPAKLRGGVLVPDAFFMIIIDEHEGKLRTLSVILPQDASSDAGWSNYVTTVAEIERRTRLDFFHEFDDSAEVQIEQQRASRLW